MRVGADEADGQRHDGIVGQPANMSEDCCPGTEVDLTEHVRGRQILAGHPDRRVGHEIPGCWKIGQLEGVAAATRADSTGRP